MAVFIVFSGEYFGFLFARTCAGGYDIATFFVLCWFFKSFCKCCFCVFYGFSKCDVWVGKFFNNSFEFRVAGGMWVANVSVSLFVVSLLMEWPH